MSSRCQKRKRAWMIPLSESRLTRERPKPHPGPPLLFTIVMQHSPTMGATDSSLWISQSFDGLGLGLPSPPLNRWPTKSNEDSPLLDVVFSQASGNTESADPSLLSKLASELIFPDDHSGSFDIVLFNSIDSDQDNVCRRCQWGSSPRTTIFC